MAQQEEVKKHLDQLEEQVVQLRKLLIYPAVNPRHSDQAWNDLMSASEEISRQWKGMSAVEEVRDQREK